MIRYCLFALQLTAFALIPVRAAENEDWKYLGQTPPGDAARLFAPEIMQHQVHSSPTFTPGGKEIYWSTVCEPNELHRIKYVKFEDGRWTGPFVAPFSVQYMDDQPFFSYDGSRLYFASRRPATVPDTDDWNLWSIERTGSTRVKPKQIGSPVNTNQIEWTPSVSRDGTLCYMGYMAGVKNECGIFLSRFINGRFSKPAPLPAPINHSSYQDWTPFIAADSSYILLASERPDQYGNQDIYITLKDKQGRWTGPYNLGPKVNTSAQERFPGVSPDGKYLFFTRYYEDPCYHDLYWIEAGDLIPDPNGLFTNIFEQPLQ